MKNIIIITLIFLSNSIKAQSSICPTLNSFVGEWRYVNGQDTIRIYLRTGDYTILTDGVRNTSIAMLFGWHEFKSGNTIIESNYTNRNMTLPTNSNNEVLHSYSLSLQLPQCNIQSQKLLGNITDITQCYETKPVIIIFNSA